MAEGEAHRDGAVTSELGSVEQRNKLSELKLLLAFK